MQHPETLVVHACAEKLQNRLGAAPPTALVLGSGLGGVVDAFERPIAVSAADVGLPHGTVAGHASRLVAGSLAGAGVVALSGRVHLYEGHPGDVLVRAIRSLHAWGVARVVLTASVGGIRDGLDPGELMLVTDHLNLQGRNPLTGPAFGTRFPDLTHAYHPATSEQLRASARQLGIPLHEGVYAAMPGPSYETPAEVRMLRTLGADVAGMSTVPEVIAAAAVGLPVAAIAIVSNRAAGLSGSVLDHDDVQETAGRAADCLTRLLAHALPRFP